jgi:hypothetical protein
VPRDQVSRLIAAVTALVVVVGIGLQIHATATSTGGFFSSKADRIANIFCFFTILSNLLLAATNAVLAVDPHRRTPLFSGLRLSGVLSMIVTGVVFHLALRGLHDLRGTAKAADLLLHTVSPILAVLGWLFVGPRGAVSRRVIGLTLIYPILWLIGTLIRGAIVGFYPYPFLDATTHGYLKVTVNCVLVAALFLGLAISAAALDRVLPAGHRALSGTSTWRGGR